MHRNGYATEHNAKGNLLDVWGGRAGLEAGYGDQLFFQCGRSHWRTLFASQY